MLVDEFLEAGEAGILDLFPFLGAEAADFEEFGDGLKVDLQKIVQILLDLIFPLVGIAVGKSGQLFVEGLSELQVVAGKDIANQAVPALLFGHLPGELVLGRQADCSEQQVFQLCHSQSIPINSADPVLPSSDLLWVVECLLSRKIPGARRNCPIAGAGSRSSPLVEG